MSMSTDFRRSLFCMALALGSGLSASAAEESAGDLAIASRPARLFVARGGRLEYAQDLPANTLLRLDPSAPRVVAQAGADGYFQHAWVVCPGILPSGWVYSGAVVNLSALGGARGESPADMLRRMAEARRRLPALIALQSEPVGRAWADLESVMRANDSLDAKSKRPEPYLARAEIWRIAQNYDGAMQDYLTATDIARARGMDLVEQAGYFLKLHRSLRQLDLMPKPPYRGDPARHYSSGVEAFYRGDLGEALAHLTDAIQLGPDEAEYWYFRALTYHRLGMEREALHDVRIGVHLERRSVRGAKGRNHHIGEQLTRIQGPLRQWLDDFREGHPAARLSGA